MCRTTVVMYQCGHWYKANHRTCEARRNPRRGCLGFFSSFFVEPCQRITVEKVSRRFCHQCTQDCYDVDPAAMLREMQQQRYRDNDRALRRMEAMNRAREREEAARSRARAEQLEEMYRAGQARTAAAVREPLPVSTRSYGGSSRTHDEVSQSWPARYDGSVGRERRGRSRHSVKHAQQRTRREREMRHAHRHIPNAQDFLAAESKAAASGGIDWSSRLEHAQPRSQQPQQHRSPYYPAGFSNNEYQAYWDGLRGTAPTVSPIGGDDLDYDKYPVVHIPEYDEYAHIQV